MTIVTHFFKAFLMLFSEMAPFLLLGFLLAGILHVWIPRSAYISKISKPSFGSVIWAALFGIPLPICSCGVLPTAVALRREGASKGASVSFLIATPSTGADSIFATYSLLGLPFAILRPLAALVTSLFGGALTNRLTRKEKSEAISKDEHLCQTDCCEGHSHRNHQENSNEIPLTISNKLKETFRYGLSEMVGNVGKWLLFGIFVGALITAFIPDDFFLVFKDYPILCMIAILIISMPMYTCSTGSIPLAMALVAKGLSPGAAFVLLMAGPATSIASMMVIGKAFGKRTLIAYLASIAIGAIAFGILIDTCFGDFVMRDVLQNISAGHSIRWVNIVASGILAVLLAINLFPPKIRSKKAMSSSKFYTVKGMSCNHCKASVEKAVKSLSGVTDAEADVKGKILRIEGDVAEDALQKAVEDAGFEWGGQKKSPELP